MDAPTSQSRLEELREQRLIMELRREERLFESEQRAFREEEVAHQRGLGVNLESLAVKAHEQKRRDLREAAAESFPLHESVGGFDYYEWFDQSPYGYAADQYGPVLGAGGNQMLNPISTRMDRRQGRMLPFLQTEQDLMLMRGVARIICTLSCPAQGVLNALTNYVIGEKGFRYTVDKKRVKQQVPDGLIEAVQETLDRFMEECHWADLEAELFSRSRRDGEYFLALHETPGGGTKVRIIEPEQVTQANSAQWTARAIREEHGQEISDQLDWYWGVLTPYHDATEIYGFNTIWLTDDGSVYYPAQNVQHFKLSDRNVKRGLSDFYPAFRMLTKSGSLANKIVAGAAVQAGIAYIRQHPPGRTQSDITTWRANKADSTTQMLNPFGGNRTVYNRVYTDSSILDVPAGQEYLAAPMGSNNGPIFVEVLQAALRWVATKWNAPEWIISADASNNNFSSSLTAEAPFTKTIQRMQHVYGPRWVAVLWKVLENACAWGRFDRFGEYGSFESLRRFLAIDVAYPRVESRDPVQETTRLKTLSDDGVIALKTRAAEEGYDLEREETKGAKQRPAEITAKADELDSEGGVTGLQQGKDGGKPGDPPDKPDGGPGPDKPPEPKGPQGAAKPEKQETHETAARSLHESKDAEGHEHKGKGPGGGQFTAGGGSPKPAHEMTKHEFQARAMSPEESTAAVSKIRAGDERSKNKGSVSHEPNTGPLVHTSIPVSLFSDDYRDFLRGSTDKNRVANYVDSKPHEPIYALPKRKGNGWQVSDGGHRLLAAIDRGDTHVNALVPADSHDKIMAHVGASDEQKPQHVTQTKAFKDWFGGSKVVDGEGKPLVVYHGTGHDFDSFSNDPSRQRDGQFLGKGFYFTNYQDRASAYADSSQEANKGSASNVKPVYLSIQNPYRAKMGEKVPPRDALIKQGHDGVILDMGPEEPFWAKIEGREPRGNEYEIVAFHPNQIKSATGNRGTFDPKSDKITETTGAIVPSAMSDINAYGPGAGLIDTKRKLHESAADQELRDAIRAAADATDTEPTEKQKASGNYSKGRFRWRGLTIAIENPKGSTRSGTDAKGKEWSVKMPAHYGYVAGKGVKQKGADGDAIDVFVGPDPESELVFIIDQRAPDGSFDEHKAVIGVANEDQARQLYLDSYSPGWKGLGAITALTLPQFKAWLAEGDTSRPLHESAALFEAAKRKPAAGQSSLWDESKVHRDAKGEFSSTGSSGSHSTPAATQDEGEFKLQNKPQEKKAEFDNNHNTAQRKMLDGMDALPGQGDLFGEPEHKKETFDDLKAEAKRRGIPTRDVVNERINQHAAANVEKTKDAKAVVMDNGQSTGIVKFMVTPSAQEPGRYQATWFSKDGMSLGHTHFDSIQDAVTSISGARSESGPEIPLGDRTYHVTQIVPKDNEAPATKHEPGKTPASDLTPHNLSGEWESLKSSIEKSDPKLSPVRAGEIAAAQISNRIQDYVASLEPKTRDGSMTPEEEHYYDRIHVDGWRPTNELMAMSGSRSILADKDEERANEAAGDQPAAAPQPDLNDIHNQTAKIMRSGQRKIGQGNDSGQKRAKAGGELGPNNEWYKGGAWIATQDLPKRVKQQLEQKAKGKVQVDGYHWEQPQPGKMSILDKLAGTVLNPRDGEINDHYLGYMKYPEDQIKAFHEIGEKWRNGERWIDVNDYPFLANVKDAALLVASGQPIPGAVLDKLPAKWRDHLTKWKPKQASESLHETANHLARRAAQLWSADSPHEQASFANLYESNARLFEAKGDDSDGQWITIGAHRGEGGEKHGGTPVKIKDGKITHGPPALAGKTLRGLSKLKPHRELKRAVDKAHKEHGFDKRDIHDAIEFVHGERKRLHDERESAKEHARQLTGLSSGDISRLANSGHDYASGAKAGGLTGERLRHFDQFAQEMAREHPELGLGDPDDPHGDFASRLWDVLGEGKREAPAKHHQDTVDEAIQLLHQNARYKPSHEEVPF